MKLLLAIFAIFIVTRVKVTCLDIAHPDNLSKIDSFNSENLNSNKSDVHKLDVENLDKVNSNNTENLNLNKTDVDKLDVENSDKIGSNNTENLNVNESYVGKLDVENPVKIDSNNTEKLKKKLISNLGTEIALEIETFLNETDSDKIHPYLRIINSFQQICPQDRALIFEKTFYGLIPCLDYFVVDQRATCKKYRAVPEECLLSLKQIFDRCLPMKSNKIPSMMLSMYKSAINHICLSPTEMSAEFMNECLHLGNNNSEAFDRAVERFADSFDAFIENQTHEQFCNIFIEMEGSVKEYVQANCPSEETTSAVMKLYAVLKQPCESLNYM